MSFFLFVMKMSVIIAKIGFIFFEHAILFSSDFYCEKCFMRCILAFAFSFNVCCHFRGAERHFE